MAQPEHALQMQVKKLCRECIATDHIFAAHDRTHNRGAQHIHEAARGVRKGWPDIEVPLPGGITFRCELKWPPNKPNEDQLSTIVHLNQLGHPTAWADSVGRFVEMAEWAGVQFRPNVHIRARQLDDMLAAQFAKAPRVPSARKPRARADASKIRRSEAIRSRTMF